MTVAGCGAYLSTLVGPELQGRVLGNNLALQVGAESMSALIGGFLAAILIPLPLIVYGVISVLGGLLLITYRKKGEAGPETGKGDNANSVVSYIAFSISNNSLKIWKSSK